MFGLWIAFLLCFCKWTVGTVTVTLLAAVLMLHCQQSLLLWELSWLFLFRQLVGNHPQKKINSIKDNQLSWG